MSVEINLMPWRQMYRNKEKKKIIIFSFCCVFLVISFFIILNLYFCILINKKQEQNHSVSIEIKNFNTILKEIKKVEERKIKIEQRLNVLKNILDNRVLIIYFFDELVKLIPKEIYLNKITVSARLITIHGFSESNNAVSNFIKNIEENPWMSSPNLIEIKKQAVTSSNSMFELNFSLISPVGADFHE